MMGSMMRRAMLGDGSTLSLDFTTGVLDPLLTFTRSTSGTYIGADGLVKTATNNVARFDYDPTTLAPKGLLIEGSATNLLNWSESFATSGGTNNNWADTNITRNSTNNTDPANGTTALRVTASAGNGTIISTAAMGTSAQRTFSIWLRRVSGTGDIQYTLDNGSTYTTQAITSSWVRYTFAATTAAQRVGIRIVTNNDSIELWGAQLETGSGASSYITTGASQGSRAADSCSLSLASIPFSTAEGSFFVRYEAPRATLGNAGQSVLNTDYQATEWVGLFQSFNSLTVSLGSWSGQSNIANGTLSTNSAAFSYGAWNGSVVPTSFAANNSAVTNANRDWNPSMPTWLLIGAASSVGASTANRDWLNGCIRTVKYWPTRLPDAQIRNLTT